MVLARCTLKKKTMRRIHGLGGVMAHTRDVRIDGFALLVEGSWCGTGFSSRIQVFLTTKFFARKLTDGYSINIRRLNRELSEFTYRLRMP
jgi:hypothetical protein